MKRLIAFLALATLLACNSLMNPEPAAVSKRFYADPQIDFNTPAFQKEKGFTTHAEMMSFLNFFDAPKGLVWKIDSVGHSQKGKPMVVAYLGNPDTASVRIWIMGGLHGDEPAGTESILHLIQMLNLPRYRHLLENAYIAFMPMANVDGFEAQERHAANGLDLNRDQTKLLAPETRYWKKAYTDFAPEVALDMHEYRPYRRDYLRMGEQGLAGFYDVCFLFSGNLNVPENLRYFTRDVFVNQARNSLDTLGYTHHDYFTSDKEAGALVINQGSVHPRSSASHHALNNCVSTLVEIRGVGLGRNGFKRRVHSSYAVALSYIQQAVQQKRLLRSTLKNAQQQVRQEVVVSSERKTIDTYIKVIDIAKADTTRVLVPLRDAFFSSPKLKRSCPMAYVIKASQQALIEKMQILGVELQPIKSALNCKAERFVVENISTEPFDWEGVKRQNVKVELEPIEMVFEAGDYWVSMKQLRSGLVAELLEPEAGSGFIKLGQIALKTGMELPIYRIQQTTNADFR